MASARQKIPKHIARELRRHVANPTTSTKSSSSSSSSSSNAKNPKMAFALLGCVGVTGLAASFPYLSSRWIGNLNAKDDPLTAAQTRRGAFNNSGTKDVGKDPQWDFATGTYKRDEEFRKMLKDNLPNEVEHGDELVKRRR